MVFSSDLGRHLKQHTVLDPQLSHEVTLALKVNTLLNYHLFSAPTAKADDVISLFSNTAKKSSLLVKV